MEKIKVILSNNEESEVVEVDPTNYILVDLRDYEESIHDIRVSSEGVIMSSPAQSVDDVHPNQLKFDLGDATRPNKKPWEFT